MKKKWMLLAALSGSLFGASGQQSLTLEQALTLALNSNHGIAIARNQAEQAENTARPGNAGLLPTVGVIGGGNFNQNNTNIVLASNDVIAQDAAQSVAYNASIQVNYTLFNGLANLNTLRQFQELKNVADENLRLTIENTLLQVTALYYEVARLSEIKRVNEESIAISKDRYDRASLRNELGSGGKLDMLNAEVTLTADSVQYMQTITALENAKRDLMVAMSQEPVSNFTVDTTLYFQTDLLLEDLEKSALAQNSFLAIARASERATQYQLKATEGRYLPQLTVGGAYNYSGQENQASFIKSSQLDGFGLTAGLRWDLFTGYTRQTAVRNAKLQLESNQEQVENTRKQILRDLENAYNLYINALFVMNKQQRNVQTNVLNFSRTVELFNLGQVIGTQFREAQLNLIQSQSSYANARYLAKIAEVQLIRIAGLLLGDINQP